MWWAKAYANFLEHIVQFDLYDFIKSCKEDEGAADANWGPPVPRSRLINTIRSGTVVVRQTSMNGTCAIGWLRCIH